MATTPLPRTRLVRSTALASVALVLLCASSQGQTPPQARQATTPSARFRPAVIHPKMTPDQRHAIESFANISNHAMNYTKNFPPRITCSPSNQTSKSRPTQSMCVLEAQFAPVCSAYG